jgi:hypothetical protein
MVPPKPGPADLQTGDDAGVDPWTCREAASLKAVAAA